MNSICDNDVQYARAPRTTGCGYGRGLQACDLHLAGYEMEICYPVPQAGTRYRFMAS